MIEFLWYYFWQQSHQKVSMNSRKPRKKTTVFFEQFSKGVFQTSFFINPLSLTSQKFGLLKRRILMI